MKGFNWRLLLLLPLAAAATACSSSSNGARDSATAKGDDLEPAAAALPPSSASADPIAPASAALDQTAPAPADAAGPAAGVANLPYARGAVFASLDEYLAYLEKQGAIDLPWWREISPGVYERVVRMPGAAREVKTRAELTELYGFER